MTALIGTSANLQTGIVQSSLVTNTYAGYFISDGSAFNLITPFQADKLEWYNYSKFGTDTNNLQGVWFRDFPAGDALIINRGTTTLTSTLETTNGVTIANTAGGFPNEHVTITGITAATPGVVTANNSYVAGQRVIITKVQGTLGATVNNMTFVVTNPTSTTFELYDIYGLPYATSGTYGSSGQSTLTGPLLGIVDSPVSYQLTLGSAIVGASTDVIYFVATQFNSYYNITNQV